MAHATGLVASWMASSRKTGLNWFCGVPGSQGSLVVRGSSVIKGMEGRLMTGGGGGLGEMKWKDHGGPGGKEIRAGKPLVRPNLGFASESCASLMCVFKEVPWSPCPFPLGTRTLPCLGYSCGMSI